MELLDGYVDRKNLRRLKYFLTNTSFGVPELLEATNYNVKDLTEDYLKLIKQEICDTNYQDNDYLFKIFKDLSTLIGKEKVDSRRLIELSKEIEEIIENRIQNDDDYIYKDDFSQMVLKRMLIYITELRISLEYELEDYYKGDGYFLINYLINDRKDLLLFNNIIRDNPNIINTYDNNHTLLFNNIVNTYLESLYEYAKNNSRNNPNNYLYYGKVIDVMLDNPLFDLEKNNKNEIRNKIQSYLSIDPSCFSKNGYKFFNSELKAISSKILNYSNKYSFKSLASKYQVNINFNPVVIGSYESLSRPSSKDKNNDRFLFNEDYIITIDHEGTNNFDDALSIRKKDDTYIIGIHIADPTYYVIPNSIIDIDARDRMSALYFSDGKRIPLFAEEMIEDYLSLKEDTYRYANSYFFVISKNGEVIGEDYKKTTIMVSKNLTDKNVVEILDKGSSNTDLQETIYNLVEVSNLLSKYFHFENSYIEGKMMSNDVANTRLNSTSIPDRIVGNTMALANHRIAKMADSKGYPYIFRNCNFTDKSKEGVERIKEELSKNESSYKEKELQAKLAGLLKGYYDIKNEGHSGFNFEAYGHITSPNRRYVDLANEEALNTWYFRNSSDYELYEFEKRLKEIAKESNRKLANYDMFRDEYEIGREKIKCKIKEKQ